MGTGDEHDGSTRDEDSELIAPVVPLRRRGEDAREGDRAEQASDEAPTAEWSVFDPPGDLPLTARSPRGGSVQGRIGRRRTWPSGAGCLTSPVGDDSLRLPGLR